MKQMFLALLVLFPLLMRAKNPYQKYVSPNPTVEELKNAKNDSRETKKYTTVVGIQDLYSTHGTHFKGVELAESYHLSPRFALGLGAEYSWCGYHFDNGFNLTDLKFLPVYADSKMNLTTGKTVTPYLHLSAGISFANYKKQDAVAPGPVSQISEQGFYLYSGGGVSFKIAGHLHAYVDTGFKGYHMSLDALDINPHGFTAKLGLEF